MCLPAEYDVVLLCTQYTVQVSTLCTNLHLYEPLHFVIIVTSTTHNLIRSKGLIVFAGILWGRREDLGPGLNLGNLIFMRIVFQKVTHTDMKRGFYHERHPQVAKCLCDSANVVLSNFNIFAANDKSQSLKRCWMIWTQCTLLLHWWETGTLRSRNGEKFRTICTDTEVNTKTLNTSAINQWFRKLSAHHTGYTNRIQIWNILFIFYKWVILT